MIGTWNESLKKTRVVGGGISGLLLSYRLLQKGHEVELYEKSSRLGGLVRTDSHPEGICEWAAHSLLATPQIEALARELGVELLSVNPKARARYLVRNGKLTRFPLTLPQALGTFFRAAFVRKATEPHTDLETWASQHLGEPALQYLLNPFVTGIFGARPSELRVDLAFPKLMIPSQKSLLAHAFAREKTARPKMVAPAHGMGEWIHCLERALLKHSRFKLKDAMGSLENSADANLALCIPAHSIAELLMQVDPKTAEAAKHVRYAPLISATVFYESSAFGDLPRGVGMLVPEVETDPSANVLGILFNSSAFEGRTSSPHLQSFTVMLGGTRNPSLLHETDEILQEHIEKAFRKFFGARTKPRAFYIHRVPNAVPLYGPDLANFQDAAKSHWCAKPGHILFGNLTGELSIRAMIEAILKL